MSGRFWFGLDLPTEYRDPAVKDHLSYNGQLHFHCLQCNEIIWVDITFGKEIIRTGSGFPCPNCNHQRLELIKFSAIESRLCRKCGSQGFASPGDRFACTVCHGTEFALDNTLIQPPYPRKLFVLIGRDEPFGLSHDSDTKFLMEYVKSLGMLPEFHRNCIYLIRFIESIFEDIYCSSPDAADLLNLASGIMREVFRGTGNPDAAYLSIAAMIRGREVTTNSVQVAVFGFNICQNVYSALARDLGEILSTRMGISLKDYGVSLARQTLEYFQSTNETWLWELRARLKWLLGDLLKSPPENR